jgi:hypothetical protein
MKPRTATLLSACAALVAGATSASALPAGSAHRAPASDEALIKTFDNVSRSTAWTRTRTIDLDFETYHPQAMEVVGDRIYLSSVEIIEPTVRYPQPVDGYDRTPGKGRGHLFVLDRDGHLLSDAPTEAPSPRHSAITCVTGSAQGDCRLLGESAQARQQET